MSSIGSVSVDFVAETKGFVEGLRVVSTETSKTMANVSASMGKASDSSGKLGDANEQAAKQTSKAWKGSTEQLGKFEDKLSETTDTAKTLADSILQLGGSLALGSVISEASQAARIYESFSMQMRVLLGDAELATKTIAELNKYSLDTPFSPKQVQTAGRSLLSFGITTDKLIPSLKTLGDISLGTGKSFEELAVLFGKAKVQGTIMGDDLMQFSEAGIPLLEQLSINLGVSASEVKKLGSESKITFDDLVKALESTEGPMSKYVGMTSEASKTTDGLLSSLEGNIAEFQKSIGEVYNSVLKPMVETLLEISNGIIAWAKENPTLAKTIVEVTAALIAMSAAILGTAGLVSAFSLVSGAIKSMQASLIAFSATQTATANAAVINWAKILGPFMVAGGVVFALTFTANFIERRRVEREETSRAIGTGAALLSTEQQRKELIPLLQEYNKQIDALKKGYEQVSKTGGDFDTKLKDQRESLNNVVNRIESLGGNLPALANELRIGSIEMDNLRRSSVNAASALTAISPEKTKDNVKKMGDSLKGSAAGTKELNEELKLLETQYKLNDKEILILVKSNAELYKSTQNQIQADQNELEKLKNKIKATKNGSEAIKEQIALIKERIKFQNSEKEKLGNISVAGVTSNRPIPEITGLAETSSLNKGIESLSKSLMQLPKSVSRLVDSMKNLLSTNQNVQQEQQKTTKAVKESELSLMDLGEAVEIFSEIVKIVGPQIADFNNALTQLGNVNAENTQKQFDALGMIAKRHYDLELKRKLKSVDDMLVQDGRYAKESYKIALENISNDIQKYENDINALESANKEKLELIKQYEKEKNDLINNSNNQLSEENKLRFEQEVERINAEYQLKIENIQRSSADEIQSQIISQELLKASEEEKANILAYYQQLSLDQIDQKIEAKQNEINSNETQLEALTSALTSAQQEQINITNAANEERAKIQEAHDKKMQEMERNKARAKYMADVAQFQMNKQAQLTQLRIQMGMLAAQLAGGIAVGFMLGGPIGGYAAMAMAALLGTGSAMALKQSMAAVQATTPPLPPEGIFEKGGIVGGELHSNGGTPIMAERGEFIINRKASEDNFELLSKINNGDTINNSNPMNLYVTNNISGVNDIDAIADQIGSSIMQRVKAANYGYL